MNIKIIEVNQKNIEQYPPTCFLNPKQKGYLIKKQWLSDRFREGMKIKVLYDESDKKIHGFIEYVPGENCWRGVSAKGYLFIHCLWITPNSYKKKGYGSKLIQEVMNDSKKQGKAGVAVVTSDDSFMASEEVFLKNKFKKIQEDGLHQLLVKQNKKFPLPKFNDYKSKLAKLKGWHIIYSNQCPWVSRFIDELDLNLIQKLKIKITEQETPKQAQEGPSIYGVFALIKDGKILANHYISATRFNNILEKQNKTINLKSNLILIF